MRRFEVQVHSRVLMGQQLCGASYLLLQETNLQQLNDYDPYRNDLEERVWKIDSMT
jgi:hypothetical protein